MFIFFKKSFNLSRLCPLFDLFLALPPQQSHKYWAARRHCVAARHSKPHPKMYFSLFFVLCIPRHTQIPTKIEQFHLLAARLLHEFQPPRRKSFHRTDWTTTKKNLVSSNHRLVFDFAPKFNLFLSLPLSNADAFSLLSY